MTMMISYSSPARVSLLAGFGLDELTQDGGLLRDELSHCMADASDEEGAVWDDESSRRRAASCGMVQ